LAVGSHSSAHARGISTHRRAWYALAASVVAFLSVLFFTRLDDVASSWLAQNGRAPDRIVTGRGEQQSAVLPDGSQIELGGLTGVQLKFTPQRRLVVADEGEVFYRVERDPARPFIVQAGPVSVTAVGTAFSVRREGGSVSVVVTEGVVEANANRDIAATSSHAAGPVRAQAGQRIVFDRGQLEQTARAVHTQPAATWLRGQLRFEEEPLRVVVASLNRYAEREIVIGDPELAELRFTGIVFDDSVEDWIEGVQVVFPIAIDAADPDRIVLMQRAE
jgi:transmembrane sensor